MFDACALTLHHLLKSIPAVNGYLSAGLSGNTQTRLPEMTVCVNGYHDLEKRALSCLKSYFASHIKQTVMVPSFEVLHAMVYYHIRNQVDIY